MPPKDSASVNTFSASMTFSAAAYYAAAGIRINVIPRQRIVKAVAITLMAETVLPTLVISRLKIQ